MAAGDPKPFVVNGVCRYTIHGEIGPRPCANIVDYQIDTTGSTMDRPTACFNLCGVILNEWHAQIRPILGNLYKFTSVSWVDLDEPDGSVGSRNTSGAITLPVNGQGSGAMSSANVAMLVRKLITGERNKRNGRMYVPGVTEGDTDASNPNVLASTYMTNVPAKWTAFLTGTNAESAGVGSYESHMVVVHILTRYPPEDGQEIGSPATGTYSVVNSLQLDSLLATQRRRLR